VHCLAVSDTGAERGSARRGKSVLPEGALLVPDVLNTTLLQRTEDPGDQPLGEVLPLREARAPLG